VTARNYIKRYKTAQYNYAKTLAPLDDKISYHDDLRHLYENFPDTDILKSTILQRLNQKEIQLYELFYEQNSSIEEFLYAYAEVSDGRASDDLARRARNSDLTSLDTIHLLTNLPEAFKLALIDVRETWVNIVYVVDFDEDAGIGSRNIFMRPHFELQVTRWTYED